MLTRNVTVPVGGESMRAYLARPEEGTGPHSSVIVLSEIFGVTAEVRRVAELLAGAGHAALAINYYHRTHENFEVPYTEDGVAGALSAAATVTRASLREDVSAAVQWLDAQPFVKKGETAVWGLGFGGTAAFVASTMSQLRGAICFYPWHVVTPMPCGESSPIDDVAKIATPLLLCFGAEDYYVSRYDMERIREALTAAGKEHHIEIYPGVGHAFFRHGRPEAVVEQRHYSDEAVAQAAADAWDLVQAFLARVFTPELSGIAH